LENIVIILDACILYSELARGLFIQLGKDALIQPKWTKKIEEEWTNNFLKNQNEITQHTIDIICLQLEKSLITPKIYDYEHHIENLKLPDPDDRHVLAAAIEANAHYIITFNLRDFPRKRLKKYNVTALHPDKFLLEIFEKHQDHVIESVAKQRSCLQNPPMTSTELLEKYTRSGLKKFSETLQTHINHL